MTTHHHKGSEPTQKSLPIAPPHRRNTAPMLSSPRCGARTRSGASCRSPAVNGKKRCRMHGGAHGSGAPKGNQNALQHGTYSKTANAQRAWIRELFDTLRDSGGNANDN
jgi:hypothetical protein